MRVSASRESISHRRTPSRHHGAARFRYAAPIRGMSLSTRAKPRRGIVLSASKTQLGFVPFRSNVYARSNLLHTFCSLQCRFATHAGSARPGFALTFSPAQATASLVLLVCVRSAETQNNIRGTATQLLPRLATVCGGHREVTVKLPLCHLPSHHSRPATCTPSCGSICADWDHEQGVARAAEGRGKGVDHIT